MPSTSNSQQAVTLPLRLDMLCERSDPAVVVVKIAHRAQFRLVAPLRQLPGYRVHSRGGGGRGILRIERQDQEPAQVPLAQLPQNARDRRLPVAHGECELEVLALVLEPGT